MAARRSSAIAGAGDSCGSTREVRLEAARASGRRARSLPPLPGQVLVGRTPADAGKPAAGLPRRAGRRCLSVSPMPLPDGGLELRPPTARGDALQRAVRTLAMGSACACAADHATARSRACSAASSIAGARVASATGAGRR
jgi:hypothetical protein